MCMQLQLYATWIGFTEAWRVSGAKCDASRQEPAKCWWYIRVLESDSEDSECKQVRELSQKRDHLSLKYKMKMVH